MNRLAIALFSTSVLVACGDDADPTPPDTSITGLAQGQPDLATFVTVLDFASNEGDLVDQFSAPGSYTVFAPTNAAFDALAVELTSNSSATAADLLTADNKDLLRTVLGYHVLTSEVTASAIPFGEPIEASAGGVFKIDVGNPPIITDGRNRTSRITQTDITASNGVIHLVDRVILPADKTIVETAQANPDFSILVEAVVAADLATTLSGAGPFTVFAPTNTAFADLLGELGVTKEQLLADTALLAKVLTYHVVPSRVFEAQAPIGAPVTTVESGTFTIDSSLMITDENGRASQIMATDVLTSNGVIHVIDTVLLPAP